MRIKDKIDTDLYMRLGEELKQARIKRRMSQRDVADVMGVSHVSIARYENGQTRIDMETLDRLCKVLGITELKCLSDDGDMMEKVYSAYCRADDRTRNAVNVLLGID